MSTTTETSRRLARRDWLVLPLIALVTAVGLFAAGEGLARIFWPQHDARLCVADNTHAKPNCTETFKRDFEVAWATQSFNECGYRGTGPCHAPAPGGRIVVVGSSTSWGYMMNLDQMWSTQAARRIGAVCGLAPDIQAVGGFGDLNDAAKSLPGVIALKPQLVVLALTPFDLFKMPDGGFDPVHAAPSTANGGAVAIAAKDGWVMKTAKQVATDLRLVGVAQHYQYLNPATYSSTYLRFGDKADFLRQPFTPAWRSRVTFVDQATAYMTQRLDAAHIPFLILLIPQQAQADIIGAGLSYPHVDPMALDRAIGDIAARHGALYVDASPLFRNMKDAPAYYYRVNGHINDRGEKLVGAGFAKALLDAHLPGLCQGSAH